MEKLDEPGSARFGNFINYYTFNPAERRLALLPPNLIDTLGLQTKKSIYILDIGCNSGALTESLYENIISVQRKFDTNVHILAVDFDETLIQRCNESSKNKSIAYCVADIMSETGRNIVKNYMDTHNIQMFDILTCFSVTMWVHLNYGDGGLKDFLRYLSTLAGYLIMEPQPWKCYRTATRRMEKLKCAPFLLYESLSWRNDVLEKINKYIEESCSMRLQHSWGITNAWSRPLLCFHSIKPKEEKGEEMYSI